MNIFIKNKICIIIILFRLISILFTNNYLFTSIDNDDEMSIIINMKNLTEEKHKFFHEIMKDLNSTRNFYFVNTKGKSLIENLNEIVGNEPVKIVQSNFPDSIFLPLVLSLYGNNIPKLVLFIEGEDLFNSDRIELITWVNKVTNEIKTKNYDYIFGNSQLINEKKIGCSLLLTKSSIIQHLLYYTDSDTTHANPFIQLSLSTQANFSYMLFNGSIKFSSLENINDRFIKNKDNYNNYLNVFPKINYEKNKKSFLNNNNLKNRQINIICENNNEDNINSTVNNLNNLNNFQYI
jgi:hypothetical protein